MKRLLQKLCPCKRTIMRRLDSGEVGQWCQRCKQFHSWNRAIGMKPTLRKGAA